MRRRRSSGSGCTKTSFVRGFAPTAWGLPPSFVETCFFRPESKKTWRHRLRRFYAATVSRRSLLFSSGALPLRPGAYPRALSKLVFSTGVEKTWRHRLRRLYAANVSRRSLLFSSGALPLRPSAYPELCRNSNFRPESKIRGGIGYADCMPPPFLGARSYSGRRPLPPTGGAHGSKS